MDDLRTTRISLYQRKRRTWKQRAALIKRVLTTEIYKLVGAQQHIDTLRAEARHYKAKAEALEEALHDAVAPRIIPRDDDDTQPILLEDMPTAPRVMQ